MNADAFAGNGSPNANAFVVTATPSSPISHAPVITIASPVIVHTMIVSINVPVIDTSP